MVLRGNLTATVRVQDVSFRSQNGVGPFMAEGLQQKRRPGSGLRCLRGHREEIVLGTQESIEYVTFSTQSFWPDTLEFYRTQVSNRYRVHSSLDGSTPTVRAATEEHNHRYQ